ncbi:hypothetical protein [Conexibacter sp. SYSU D00693]|uniref:hypothetical protein n=1 Tax=Conexibacter sp. SYSU D00693 TaxID=2812560 RepID=UPI00196B71E1|nr:hypothetical protein [Conexibacter sp. SYSU D00693]
MDSAKPVPTPVEQAPRFVGLVTLVIGVALLVAPRRFGPLADLEPGPARAVGAADLALVPGLLSGRNPARWMLARGALNLVFAAHFREVGRRRDAKRARLTQKAMLALTAADTATAVQLRGR